MNIKDKLKEGIKAAKKRDLVAARTALYDVVDIDPKNEIAWIWLSSVAETIEDRQICLENVLIINPNNDYAKRSLRQIYRLQFKATQAKSVIKLPQLIHFQILAGHLIRAFWFGISLFFLGIGLIDLSNWGLAWLRSRAFPYYITPIQLFSLVNTIAFFICGILAANITWALFRRHKIGYIASILLSLGLIPIGPTIAIISEDSDYLLIIFVTLMPTLILFLTLMSQTGLDHDRQLAPSSRRYKT